MTRREPIDRLEAVAREILPGTLSDRTIPSRLELLSAMRRFESVPFAVPDSPDSDGFLFEYGPVNWFPQPTFVVGLARQLEILDEDGEHDHYSQLNAEYRYAMDVDLAAVGPSQTWWFRSSSASFTHWLDSVANDSIWGILEGKQVRDFEVYLDQI